MTNIWPNIDMLLYIVQVIAELHSCVTVKSSSSSTMATLKNISLPSDNMNEDFIHEEKIIERLADISMDKKSQMGYQHHDMILTCTFAGFDCDPFV